VAEYLNSVKKDCFEFLAEVDLVNNEKAIAASKMQGMVSVIDTILELPSIIRSTEILVEKQKAMIEAQKKENQDQFWGGSD